MGDMSIVVDQETHRKIKVQASKAGLSIREYVKTFVEMVEKTEKKGAKNGG